MEKPKLSLDELVVSSFVTGGGDTLIRQDPILTTINDPTAATRCYYCPPRTYDMNCQLTIGQEVY